MMSLAAIPAYLLARRMLSTWWALGAAVLTVALPSMVYTGTLMTENAFYPIFLFAVLAVVVWIERPSTTTTLWVVALIALAYLTRAQALAFGPAILTAPLLYVWAQRRGWRALKDYRLMYGLGVARRPARDHRPGRARRVAARGLRRVRGRGRDALPLLAGRRSGSGTSSA